MRKRIVVLVALLILVLSWSYVTSAQEEHKLFIPIIGREISGAGTIPQPTPTPTVPSGLGARSN